jgi:uncharacterized protein with HEPN domain
VWVGVGSRGTAVREERPPRAWVVGLRNRLIHGYDFVDFDILWQIISHDVPPLISALERILASNETA